MIFIDTHTHLYLEEFEPDRHQMVERAIEAGVKYMMLPNIDSTSVHPMLELCKEFPGNIMPMIGLHPTSVKENYMNQLAAVECWLDRKSVV